jgi:hypothetical protein
METRDAARLMSTADDSLARSRQNPPQLLFRPSDTTPAPARRSARPVQRLPAASCQLPAAKSVTLGSSLEAHASTCATCGAVGASSPPDTRASVTHSQYQYSTCILPCCASAAACLEPASSSHRLACLTVADHIRQVHQQKFGD